LEKPTTATDNEAFLKKQSTTDEDDKNSPALKMRAYRLIKASCVLVFLCLVVGYRIALTKIQYPEHCHSSPKIASTQWWAIICFNIMPFAFACINWLNAILFYASLRQNKRPQPKGEESLLFETLLWVSVVALVYLNVLAILHFVQWVDKLGNLAEARRRKVAEEGQKEEPIYYTWKFVGGTVYSYNSNSVGWTCIFNSAGSTAVTTMGT
jgi:NADH:ubiquinone oxidoreductase subunit 5 (subunit L)/multisubunit Na+/H+ antiporter MnhA subunit